MKQLPEGRANVVRWLKRRGACQEAVDWVKENEYESLADGWDKCQRSDWMLWLLDKVKYENDRDLRLFACACVRAVWDKLTDERSRNVVEVAERFAVGDATEEELTAARSAAAAAAAPAAAPAYSAARAAWSAAWSAWPVVRLAAESAYSAALATWSATWLATRSAARSAAESAWAAQADILRDKIGNPFRRLTCPQR